MDSRTTDFRRRFVRWPAASRDPLHVEHIRERAGKAPGAREVKLSIVMPVYNEERTVASAVRAALSATYPCEVELIIVDDGSSDRTPQILEAVRDPRAIVHRHPTNLGKGAALQTAAELATGTHMVPFDADLEYSPADLPQMLEPVLHGRCDVVYGTRLFGAHTMYQSYRHAMGNRIMTLAANVLFDAYLSDLHTCLKLIPVDLFRSLELRENGFGLDTEITAKILRAGIRPFEVPVSYHSRSYAHGKKITARHGIECLVILARVRFTEPARRERVLEVVADRQLHADEVPPADGVIEADFRPRERQAAEAARGSATG
jgi:glycosyltransferase involved in cell wall biosynthesis